MSDESKKISIRLGNKPQSWFDSNGGRILKAGQHVYLSDDSGLFKKGDNVRSISQLPWLGGGVKNFADLDDVEFVDLEDGEVPIWDADLGKFVNGTISGGGSVESVNDVFPDEFGNIELEASDVGADLAGAAAAAEQAAKDYADSLVVGLWDDRGNYNASVNTFPATGGSGVAGAILKGDIWTISVGGTLGGEVVTAGDTVRALVDTPEQVSSNWSIAETNIGYVPENSTNKDTDPTFAADSDVRYPSQKAVRTAIANAFASKIITTIASSATPTLIISGDNRVTDVLVVTGLAVGATFAVSGTPTEDKPIIFYIRDNNTARTTLFPSENFILIGTPNPNTTVANKWLVVGARWSSAMNKWKILAVNQEA